MMSTDDAPVLDVLRTLRTCAYAWEGGARIIGNIRAVDISRACNAAIEAIGVADDYRRAEGSQAEEDRSVEGFDAVDND